MADVTDSGVLTTASDLLFAGGREGYFFALTPGQASSSGEEVSVGRSRPDRCHTLWPGKQYVAIPGNALFVCALRQ